MATISIDKDKLELRIAKGCSYFSLDEGGSPLCRKQRKDECNLDFITKIELDCPYDCPHRDEYDVVACKLGKCGYVKNIIKEMEV